MSLQLLIHWAVLPLFAGAFLLTTWRLLAGPTNADRVVALDLLSIIFVGAAAALAIVLEASALGDAVLVIALVGFLGTVAYGLYIARSSA